MSDFLIENGVLKKYTGNDEVVVIPDSVTSIGANAFDIYSRHISRFRIKTKKIIIPNSVTSIGDDAFFCCSSLTSISIPASVTRIGDGAFYNCTSLRKVHITDFSAWCGIEFKGYASNPLKYAHNLYLNGELVRDLVIPDSVTKIKSCSFSDCTSLVSITIPASVTSIGNKAFDNCVSLKEVHITDLAAWCAISFESFSSNPLAYAHDLYLNGELVSDLIIPDGVTSMEKYVFGGCRSLTSSTIPDSVTSIGNSAFYHCTSLANIIIPDSVTSIGANAFDSCTSLASITIPTSVTSIGNYVFFNCESLKEVHITDLAAWCAIDFDLIPFSAYDLYLNGELACDLVIPEGVTRIGSGTFGGCRSIKSITIPASVTSIGDNAFGGCTSLASITIPASVTSVESDAFYNCESLKEVHITNLAAWCAISFESFSSNPLAYAHNLYLNGELVCDLVISDPVTEIGKYAFYGCTSLKSFTVISYAAGIEDKAFFGCALLERVVLSSNMRRVAFKAFGNCTALTEVIVPEDSKTVFSSAAFDGCSNISKEMSNWAKEKCKLLTICSENEAEIRTPEKQNPVYLHYWSYGDVDYEIIRTEADQWQILSIHSVGSDYGYSSSYSNNTSQYYEIPDDKVVVKEGHFAGIMECSNSDSYMKGMSHDTSVVVALAHEWDGKPVRCGHYGSSFSSDDHESWDTTTHYLVKKE